jgi:hypothetical protein
MARPHAPAREAPRAPVTHMGGAAAVFDFSARRASDRERKARQRAREAMNRLAVPVEIDLAAIEDLITVGLLPIEESEDKVAVGRAIAKLIDAMRRVDLADLVAR